MNSNGLMIVCAKETFYLRGLVKRLFEEQIPAFLVSSQINDIEAHWNEANLICLYIDSEDVDDTLEHYLIDKMVDTNKRCIIIGNQNKYDFIMAEGASLVYGVLPEPLDYHYLAQIVNDFNHKVSNNELKKSILIVDDDPVFMGLVHDWLKDLYNVSMVNSGMRAIKWLASNKTDLILLDYEMPITDGRQVLEMLRNDEDTKNIPVFFLTGKDDEESVVAVMSLKPQGYLLKKIRKEEFIDRIKLFFATNMN